MTNKERLQALDTEGLYREMKRYAESPLRGYFDLREWLNSEDESYPLHGEEVAWHNETYIKVDESEMFRQPYATIVSKDGAIRKVPEKELT